MKFYPRDKVKFLNEVGDGIVVSVQGNNVIISDKDGFEYPVQASDLILVERPLESPVAKDSDKQATGVADDMVHKAVNSKKYSGFIPGVYLVFAPDNEQIPIAAGGRVYIVNYTDYRVFYQMFFSGGKFPETHYSIIDAKSADFLADYSQEDLRQLKNVFLQCLPVAGSMAELFRTNNIQVELKFSRFQKEDNYNDNPFFDFCALSVLLESEASFGRLTVDVPENEKIRHDQDARITGSKSIIDSFIVEEGFAEIDLHIEKIRSDYKKMSDEQKMITQLAFFRQTLDAAMEREIKRIVYIHGVGVGMLKSELYKILKQYPSIRYSDASFRRYGIGATEVEIL